ncbi:sulfatase [Salmonella bongori]|nr:sulfatase [Salmonella bongori]
MPEILKKAGIYTHLISDHLHYWEDGGGNYHNRYSSWEVVRGQEGDPLEGERWRAAYSTGASCSAKTDPEVAFRGCGVTTGQIVNTFSRRPDFPQTKVFDAGCDFIHKNHAEDNWLLAG